MGFLAAIASGLRQYFDWRGRSSRSEYWWFTLFFALCDVLGVALSAATDTLAMASLVYLGLTIPALGMGVRRLHDTGRSGGWWFVSLIPLIGAVVLIVFYCTRGQRGANRYGPPPAGREWD